MISEPYSVMTANAAVKAWEDKKYTDKINKLNHEQRLGLVMTLLSDHPELFPQTELYRLLKEKLNELP